MEETPLDAPSLRVTATLPHFQEWQPAFLITDINLLLHVATRATSPVYCQHSHLGLLPIVPTAFQLFLPVPTSKSGNLGSGPFTYVFKSLSTLLRTLLRQECVDLPPGLQAYPVPVTRNPRSALA
jgi:hypothetical protein